MNSIGKYMARLIFGNIKGLKYTKKNLIKVCENPGQYRIINTSTSPYSEKFITINSKDNIRYSVAEKSGSGWIEHQLSINEFWNFTKDRKSKFIIILI